MRKHAAILALPVFALLLAAATWKVVSTPNYSFDSYMYSYLAIGDATAFKTVPGVPPKHVAMADEAYSQQAPYYRVKVLFVALVRLAAPVVGVLQAPPAVSGVAYILLGGVVWAWLGALGVHGAWRAAAASLVMFSSVVTDSARDGTPDLLCSLFLVAGAWLLTATRRPFAGAIALLLATCTRTDTLVLAGLLLVLAAWQKKLSPGLATAFATAMLASYVAIAQLGNSYAQLLDLLLAATHQPSYAGAFLHHLAKTEVAIYAPFALLALIAVKRRYQTGLLAVCAVSLVVRYVLLPHFEVRYLVPQAIIAAVVGAASVLRQASANTGVATACAEDSTPVA